MNQSQPNKTSDIQSHRYRGIASYNVTFPHLFSLTPPENSPHALSGLLKLNGLWGGKTPTPALIVPAGVTVDDVSIEKE